MPNLIADSNSAGSGERAGTPREAVFPHRDGEIADWAREKDAGLASAELLPGTLVVRVFNAIGAVQRSESEPVTRRRMSAEM